MEELGQEGSKVLQKRAQIYMAYNKEDWNKFVMAMLDLNGPLSCI